MFWLFVSIIIGLVAFGGIFAGNAAIKAAWLEGHSGSARTPDPKDAPRLPLVVYVIPFGLIALIALLNAFVIVDPGEVGIVVRVGEVQATTFGPGFHTKLPYFDEVEVFDVRTQKEQVDAAAASKDLQEVKATIALNYHLDESKANEVFLKVGPAYKTRIVDPTLQEAFKFATAQFTASDLITQREVVKTQARDFLRQRLATFNVIVDEFNIVNFDFSEAFNKAIEDKQVAQQQVQTAQNRLEQARVEAEQQIVTATANAEAQRLQQQTLSDLYVQFLAVQKWNGILPTVTGAIPFINVPTATGTTGR